MVGNDTFGSTLPLALHARSVMRAVDYGTQTLVV